MYLKLIDFHGTPSSLLNHLESFSSFNFSTICNLPEALEIQLYARNNVTTDMEVMDMKVIYIMGFLKKDPSLPIVANLWLMIENMCFFNQLQPLIPIFFF